MMVLGEETDSDAVFKAKVVTQYIRPFDISRKVFYFYPIEKEATDDRTESCIENICQ